MVDLVRDIEGELIGILHLEIHLFLMSFKILNEFLEHYYKLCQLLQLHIEIIVQIF